MSNTITPTVFYRMLKVEGLEIFYCEVPHLSSERGQSVSREQKVAVVDAYLNRFLTKNLSKVRFADDVTFDGPRMPKLVGKGSILAC